MNAGLNAAIFYLGAGALTVGTIRSLRASVERQARDGAGIALALAGTAGLIVAIVAFATGSKQTLPF